MNIDKEQIELMIETLDELCEELSDNSHGTLVLEQWDLREDLKKGLEAENMPKFTRNKDDPTKFDISAGTLPDGKGGFIQVKESKDNTMLEMREQKPFTILEDGTLVAVEEEGKNKVDFEIIPTDNDPTNAVVDFILKLSEEEEELLHCKHTDTVTKWLGGHCVVSCTHCGKELIVVNN